LSDLIRVTYLLTYYMDQRIFRS